MTLLSWSVLVIAYLSGYAATYFSFRYIIKRVTGESWTLQIKLMCLLFSVLSWITLLYITVIYLLGKAKLVNMKKEAKW